jgi:hypothetical protein
MSRAARSVSGVLAVGLCSVVMAGPALAKSQRITGGRQTVTSSAIAHLVAFLRSQGITVTAIGPARLGQSSLVMPVVGGRMTVPSLHGQMRCRGGVQFKKGNRVLRIRSYGFSDRHGVGTLSALISGRRVALHRIALARMATPKAHVSGTTGTMHGTLTVTAAWANLIDRLVGRHVVSAGSTLGDLSATVHMT